MTWTLTLRWPAQGIEWSRDYSSFSLAGQAAAFSDAPIKKIKRKTKTTKNERKQP